MDNKTTLSSSKNEAPQKDVYTGPLTDSHCAQINAILSASGIEKPQKPTDYLGTAEEWDEAWQNGIKLMLKSSLRRFDTDMPADMHKAIKDELKEMLQYMSPGSINKFNFYEPIDQRPSIGDVHDYICGYFSGQPNYKSTLLSRLFYTTTVGDLDKENTLVYKGVSEWQHNILSLLYTDFIRVQNSVYNGTSHDGTFKFIVDKSLSIQELKDFVNLFDKNTEKTEVEEQIINDFYAIASASHSAQNHDEFTHLYDFFACKLKVQLLTRINLLQDKIIAILPSSSPVDTLYGASHTPNTDVIAIIKSMPDVLRTYVKLPGFLRPHTLSTIYSIIPISELKSERIPILLGSDIAEILATLPTYSRAEFLRILGDDRIKNMTFSGQELGEILNNLTQEEQSTFLTMLGEEGLKRSVNNSNQLASILNELPQDAWTSIETLLENDYITSIVTGNIDLITLLKAIDINKTPAFLTKIGSNDVKSTITQSNDLSFILLLIGQNKAPAVLTWLGDAHLIRMIKSFSALCEILTILIQFKMHEPISFLTTLGSDHIKRFVNYPHSLYQLCNLLEPEQCSAFLTLLGDDTIKQLFIENADSFNNGLAFFMNRFPNSTQTELMRILGSDLPRIINQEEPECIQHAMSVAHIKRSYTYYSRYSHKYDSVFDDDNIVASISSIFNQINGSQKYRQGHFYIHSDGISQKIITKCAETPKPSHANLLKFLETIQKDIDSGALTSSLIHPAPAPNGEVSMRIMYCIEKLIAAERRPDATLAMHAAQLNCEFEYKGKKEKDTIIQELGCRLPGIINNKTPNVKRTLLEDQQLSRAYKFHTRYANKYDTVFDEKDPSASISRLFSQINGVNKYRHCHFFTHSNTVAQSIIDQCKRYTSHEDMIGFLQNKLYEIDAHEKTKFIGQTTPSHNGEAAMRIMYCIEQLRRVTARQRVAPASMPVVLR